MFTSEKIRDMSDTLYELPLPEEYLVLLGRQARAAGTIELITKWLTRALLTPQDVNASAKRVRTLQYRQVTQVARDLAPARADAMDAPIRDRFLREVTSWLDASELVMRKRNAYLHGFWLAPDEDSPLPGFWDREQRRTGIDLPTMTAAAEEAERIEAGGVSVLRQSLGMLGCPKPNPLDG